MAQVRTYDPKAPRRYYRGEEAWFELLDEVGPRALRSAFIAVGVSAAVAGNLVWFLVDQRDLDRHLSKGARMKYRDILEDLPDPDTVRRRIPGYFTSPRSRRAA